MTDTKAQRDAEAHRYHTWATDCSICQQQRHQQRAAQQDSAQDSAPDDARAALMAARLDLAQWRAQSQTWENNAGQAVALANRELRKRQEAYAKLDILMAEYRRLALALADIAVDVTAPGIQAVTEAFLARLSLETGKLAPGGSSEGADAVGAGLDDGGAGRAHRD
jgi:hypothetical protein